MAGVNPKTLLDLPMEDILIDNVGKYLNFVDIYNLRKCSKHFEAAADAMAAKKSAFILSEDHASNFFIRSSDEQFNDFTSWVVQRRRPLHFYKIIDFVLYKPEHDYFLCKLLLFNHAPIESFSARSLLPMPSLGIHQLAIHDFMCDKLTYLSLDCFKIVNNFLNALAYNNKQLREVRFLECEFSERALRKFLKKQPRLERIDLTGSVIYEKELFFTVIKKNLPKLKSVIILDVKGVTERDIW